MSVTALWTAVHYRIPLLIVVANNRSFYNDEVHQERMAILRNRPVENKWIGQKMLDPEIDLAGTGARPGRARLRADHEAPRSSRRRFAKAVAAVENGEVAVVDVRIEPGYGARDAGAMTRRKSGNDALPASRAWPGRVAAIARLLTLAAKTWMPAYRGHDGWRA